MNIERLFSRLPLIVMTFLWGVSHAQTVREDVSLFDKPDGQPGTVRLKSGTPVKSLRRQGFWVEVSGGSGTGWVKVSAINFAGPAGGATAIDTGRMGSGNIVATSAARGLTSKDMLDGKPNLEEVEKLESLSAHPQAMHFFASSGGLVAVKEPIRLAVPKQQSVNAADSEKRNVESKVQGKKKGDEDW